MIELQHHEYSIFRRTRRDFLPQKQLCQYLEKVMTPMEFSHAEYSADHSAVFR
jgi:hypothetical protein